MQKRSLAGGVLAFALAILAASGLALISFGQERPFLQNLVFDNWTPADQTEFFSKDNLFGYIDGGAEIFLQYGFEELSIFRYRSSAAAKPEKAITLEIYRMDSPEDAFGIFSVRRRGDEKTSAREKAPHWITSTQANLVKGSYYISISGQNCAENDIKAFLTAVSDKITASFELPPQLSWLPAEGLQRGSERYIKGELAAVNESPLLNSEFWRFREGTVAVSAKYEPSKARLIIIQFKRDKGSLSEEVKKIFSEYLDDVSSEEGLVKGKNAAGQYFVFSQKGEYAFLVCAEPDLDAARLLLKQAGARANN
jgi:hypothetical protein